MNNVKEIQPVQFDSIEAAQAAFQLGTVFYKCQICGGTHSSEDMPPILCFYKLWQRLQAQLGICGDLNVTIFKDQSKPDFESGAVRFFALDMRCRPERFWFSLNPVSFNELVELCRAKLRLAAAAETRQVSLSRWDITDRGVWPRIQINVSSSIGPLVRYSWTVRI